MHTESPLASPPQAGIDGAGDGTPTGARGRGRDVVLGDEQAMFGTYLGATSYGGAASLMILPHRLDPVARMHRRLWRRVDWLYWRLRDILMGRIDPEGRSPQIRGSGEMRKLTPEERAEYQMKYAGYSDLLDTGDAFVTRFQQKLTQLCLMYAMRNDAADVVDGWIQELYDCTIDWTDLMFFLMPPPSAGRDAFWLWRSVCDDMRPSGVTIQDDEVKIRRKLKEFYKRFG